MSEPTAQQQLSQMITGYWISQAIYVAAKLNLADRLADGPRSADDLARETGMHAPSLYRLLRALASVGVFDEGAERCFALTPLSENLRSDQPGSQHAMAIMMGEEHYNCWGNLLESIRTGEPAFERLYGQPIFDYLSDHPEQARTFDAAMTGIHGPETQAVADAYDLSNIGTLADIGGGNGSTLIGLLRQNPALRGLLFDLPGVVDRARGNLKATGLDDRCQFVGGSFFESVPGGADAYMLRHIIHDWNDDQSLAILKTIRRAMPENAKLLVVESVIPSGNTPSFGKILDLTMLLIPGGLERTEDEYRRLFESAGFRLSRIVPTAADVSVIEGRPI